MKAYRKILLTIFLGLLCSSEMPKDSLDLDYVAMREKIRPSYERKLREIEILDSIVNDGLKKRSEIKQDSLCIVFDAMCEY